MAGKNTKTAIAVICITIFTLLLYYLNSRLAAR